MPHIAFVEDNEDNRQMLRAILEDCYALDEYESAYDALEGFGRSMPDLVLMDISLPGMDGVEALGCLRKDERLKHLPVIALTAHAMIGDRSRFIEAGFDDYVTKPITDETILLGAINRHLVGKR